MPRIIGYALIGLYCVGLAVLAFPYAVSAYHLEMGGRALETAMTPVFPDWLAPYAVEDLELLQDGIAHLEAARRWDGRNVRALQLLARARLSQGEPEAALEALQEAVVLRPDNPLVHLELGDVYDALGWSEEALAEYEAGGIGSRLQPAAANYLKLADAQAAQGSGDVAIRHWQRALELDAGNLYALYRLTGIHRDLGDEEHAVAYEEQLRYFVLEGIAVPSDFRLADYLARTMGTLVEEGIWDHDTLLNVVSYQVWQFHEGVAGLAAERVLKSLLESQPEDTDLWFYLGELHQRRGEWDAAETAYRQVLKIDSNYAQAYLRIGMLYEARAEEETRR